MVDVETRKQFVANEVYHAGQIDGECGHKQSADDCIEHAVFVWKMHNECAYAGEEKMLNTGAKTGARPTWLALAYKSSGKDAEDDSGDDQDPAISSNKGSGQGPHTVHGYFDSESCDD